MFRIGTVRQTQFPVLIGLVHDAVQHLYLELSLVIPQRHENTDLRHIGEYRFFLFLPLLRVGKASGTVGFHQALLVTLVTDLPQNIFGTTAMRQPFLLSLGKMDHTPGRSCSLPEFIFLDSVQFELQIFLLRFQYYDLVRQIRTFFMLPLVGFLIIDLGVAL